MSRPFTQRKSYTGDRALLARLEKSIDRESRVPDELKQAARERARDLSSALLEMDQRIDAPKPKPKRRAST